MKKISAPNPEYKGVSASVKFENGIGYTADENLISWFTEHGYKVEDSKESKKNKAVENVPLNQTNSNNDQISETEKQNNSVTDFPEGFPSRAKQIFEKSEKTFKEVSEMSREKLIEVKGISEKTADAIIAFIALRGEK